MLILATQSTMIYKSVFRLPAPLCEAHLSPETVGDIIEKVECQKKQMSLALEWAEVASSGGHAPESLTVDVRV